MSKWIAVLAVAFLAAAGVGADESPLAAAARKERERRSRLEGQSKKTVTERDLASGGVAAGQETSEEPEAPGEDAGGKPKAETAKTRTGKAEKSSDELRADRRAAIQREIDDHSKRLGEIRRQIDLLERDLQDLSAYAEGPRRGSLRQALEDLRKEIAMTEARMADLEEEARRLGVSVSRP